MLHYLKPFKGVRCGGSKCNGNEIPNVMCLILISFSNNHILSRFVKIVFVKQANGMATVHNLYRLKGHLGILTATLRVVLQSKWQ